MLNINNINFQYPSGNKVLNNINISLKKGEKAALIGPNGSGKTTLFLLCCGILKPDSGEIKISDKEVMFNNFNSDITYLFQSPDDQLFSSTIYDDIAFGPMNMGLTKEEIKLTVEKSLNKVNSLDLSDKASFHLSGGQKRMAAIASLLAMNPKVLLFDEPTANLDTRNRRKVTQLIQNMDETIFISSHNMEFLLETCTKVFLIDNGIIINSGNIIDIMSNKDLMEKHGLEVPYSLC